LRLFTYRALKELLELHQFKIIRVLGSYTEEPGRFPKLLYVLAKVISVYSALSSNLIFMVQKVVQDGDSSLL